MLKIGLISDIHNETLLLEKSLISLKKKKVKTIFMLGDYTELEVLNVFKFFNFKINAVFGNADINPASFIYKAELLNLQITFPKNNFYLQPLKILSYDIFLLHDITGQTNLPKPDWNYLKKFSFVIFGHTHQANFFKRNSTWFLNPGSIFPFYGLNFTPCKSTFAILDLESKNLQLFEITGKLLKSVNLN